VLIDFRRARQRRRPRPRWFEKDVAALLHSSPRGNGKREGLRFLAAYLDRTGLRSRRARRSFARAVAARRRKMAAHRPRHGESFRVPAEMRGPAAGAPA
jgi:hypothetical protein